jgi:hypothetical protein
MPRTLLKDEYWSKLLNILLDLGVYHKKNLRLKIEGILYRIRTGIPWEDIPPFFGKGNSLFAPSSIDGRRKGFFQSILNALTEFPDMEMGIYLTGSYVKVPTNMQRQTVGEGKPLSAHSPWWAIALKIHLAVDACGKPCRFSRSHRETV